MHNTVHPGQGFECQLQRLGLCPGCWEARGGLWAGEGQCPLWVPVRDTGNGETRGVWPGCVCGGFTSASSLGGREHGM